MTTPSETTTPSWQEKVLENVARTSARTQSSRKPEGWVSLLIRVHPDIRKAIRLIAQERDLSMASYLKRVLITAIVKETGDPLAKWLPLLPNEVPYGKINSTQRDKKGQRTFDSGIGWEGMCTHPGCNEVHR